MEKTINPTVAPDILNNESFAFSAGLKAGDLLVLRPNTETSRVSVTTLEGIQLGFDAGNKFKVIANDGTKVTLQLMEDQVMDETEFTVAVQDTFWQYFSDKFLVLFK